MKPSNILPFPVRVRVIRALLDGESVRSAADLTDTNKDTAQRLRTTVGRGCTRLLVKLVPARRGASGDAMKRGRDKTPESREAAAALRYFWYLFGRVDAAMGTTPAVALGAADHAWTVEEVVRAALLEVGEMNEPTYKTRKRRVPRKTHAADADAGA